MDTLRSFIGNEWQVGGGTSTEVVNPATEELLARFNEPAGLPLAVEFARERGWKLRRMPIGLRAMQLRKLAELIKGHHDELIRLSMENGGNTVTDAEIDVGGSAYTLEYYADLGIALGNDAFLVDGDRIKLGRGFFGQHICVPRAGIALLINAFNFPLWGMFEKLACAILAGVPVIVKPATPTSLIALRMTELIINADIFPRGVFQFVLGSVEGTFSFLNGHDTVAFTGSRETANKLRTDPRLAEVKLNIEAGSLNAAVLGPDVQPSSPAYQLFLNDIIRAMTQKAGQMCTAIRRVFVPEPLLERAGAELVARLSLVKVGNPFEDGINMGPLTSRQQLNAVREGICDLRIGNEARFWGNAEDVVTEPVGQGFFHSPVLLRSKDATSLKAVHETEVFGPVATLMPYDGSVQAASQTVELGNGSLVTALYSNDVDWIRQVVAAITPFQGRIYIGNDEVTEKSMGPSVALPQLVHGGPGRAGNGVELGGIRGVLHYMQPVALQGSASIIEALLQAPTKV